MERPKRDPAPVPGSQPFEAQSMSSHSRLRAAPVKHSGRYGSMRDVLLRYLSPILVDTVLSRSLHSRRLDAELLTSEQVAELASDVMVGLRLFVPEERLSQLMLDLAAVLGDE